MGLGKGGVDNSGLTVSAEADLIFTPFEFISRVSKCFIGR